MTKHSILKCVRGFYQNIISHETIGQNWSVSKEDLVIQVATVSNERKLIKYLLSPILLKFSQTGHLNSFIPFVVNTNENFSVGF